MRRWVLALMCVAACGGQGLDIEVHGDMPFDAVELYIAYDTCHDCAGVAWPGAQQSTDAESVYLLKGDEMVVRTTELEGKSAILHLEASAGFAQTTAIAVVGYRAGEIVGIRVMYDKTIPRDDQEKWSIELGDIARADTDVATPPPDGQPAYRALAWPREASPTVPDPTGYASCLAYQEWDGDAWKTQFFVPETDTDCDGTPPDCDPLWAHRPLGTARCVEHPTSNGLTNACVLGTKTCVDESTGETCTPATTALTCVPSGVCDACADADNLVSCLKNSVPQPSSLPTTTPDGVPMMVCPFVPDPDNVTPNGPCVQAQFNGEHMTFVVPGACNAPSGTLAVLRPLSAPFSGGSPTMTIGGTAVMTVHATGGTSSCSIGLDWTEGAAGNPQTVLLALRYGAREVLVPIYIGFKTNAICPLAPQPCMPIGNWPEGMNTGGDSLFECTR
jgi:hypothetical protein